MSADYYYADTENGLFMLLQDLNRDGNAFVSITPADRVAGWFASVSLLPNGTYEVLRMADGGKQEVFVQSSADLVAHDLTRWLAERGREHRARSNKR